MGLSSRKYLLVTFLLVTVSSEGWAQGTRDTTTITPPTTIITNTGGANAGLINAQANGTAPLDAEAVIAPIDPAANNPAPANPIQAAPLAPAAPLPPALPPQAQLPAPSSDGLDAALRAAALSAPQAANTAAPAVVPLTETPAPVATNVQGYSNQPLGGVLPVNSGMMPVTNAGMDMNINPDMVGGIDGAPEVPYEVQLQQRTEDIAEQARAKAFEQAKRSALPMEPHEIREVLSRLKDTQEAVQSPVRPEPHVGNRIETVSTDPSEAPKTINLGVGNVTTLNIIDATGEPWPIMEIGFGGNFDVKPPEPGGHVVRVTPLRDFARGNLVVRLLKMTTPVTFSLRSGGDSIDYRFDARIPENGPNAKMPIIDRGIGAIAGDKSLTAFLEGATPSGAEKLVVDGPDGATSAYRFAGALYVRTPLSLLSPAWQGSATSADGMNVYQLNDTPVLLLSDKGNLVRARISDAPKNFKE